jgi:hypothetical protein
LSSDREASSVCQDAHLSIAIIHARLSVYFNCRYLCSISTVKASQPVDRLNLYLFVAFLAFGASPAAVASDIASSDTTTAVVGVYVSAL